MKRRHWHWEVTATVLLQSLGGMAFHGIIPRTGLPSRWLAYGQAMDAETNNG